MKNENEMFKVPDCKLTIGEKWGSSFLVTYPVSYSYNGGTIIDGKWYKGFEVVKPKVPVGYKLMNIGIGLQLNGHPPYATMLLKPIDDHKVSKKELKALLEN